MASTTKLSKSAPLIEFSGALFSPRNTTQLALVQHFRKFCDAKPESAVQHSRCVLKIFRANETQICVGKLPAPVRVHLFVKTS